MEGILSQNGVILSDKEVRNFFKHKYQTLLNKLTVRTKQKIGPDKVAKIYKYDNIDGNIVLHLPRNVGKGLLEKGVIDGLHNTIPDGRVVKFDMQADLFENQQIVIDHLMNNYFTDENQEDGFSTAVLNMGAGLGKSFTAAGLIERLGRNVLYVTMRGKLQKQAYDDLNICFPNNKVWKTDGTTNAMNYADNADILIMVINSAASMSDSFFAKFGVVIFDEIHAYCSAGRAKIFWKCQVRNVLGMSATTSDRDDNFDAVYYKHFGEPVHAVKIPGFQTDDTKFLGEVTAVKYFGTEQYTQKLISDATGYVDFGQMLAQFIKDPLRNQLCVDEIVKLLEDPTCKRYVIAFSDRVEHLSEIEKMLVEKYNDPTVAFTPELVTMKGGSGNTVLDRANHARVILTTYGYSGTGISIQHMNSEVFLTPRKNGFKQILPRAMRRGSDVNIVRKFIDIIDSATTVKNQFYSRKKAYDYYGFKIIETKVDKRTPYDSLEENEEKDEEK